MTEISSNVEVSETKDTLLKSQLINLTSPIKLTVKWMKKRVNDVLLIIISPFKWLTKRLSHLKNKKIPVSIQREIKIRCVQNLCGNFDDQEYFELLNKLHPSYNNSLEQEQYLEEYEEPIIEHLQFGNFSRDQISYSKDLVIRHNFFEQFENPVLRTVENLNKFNFKNITSKNEKNEIKDKTRNMSYLLFYTLIMLILGFLSFLKGRKKLILKHKFEANRSKKNQRLQKNQSNKINIKQKMIHAMEIIKNVEIQSDDEEHGVNIFLNNLQPLSICYLQRSRSKGNFCTIIDEKSKYFDNFFSPLEKFRD